MHRAGVREKGTPAGGDLETFVRAELPGILEALRKSDVHEIELTTASGSLRMHRRLEEAGDTTEPSQDATVEPLGPAQQTVAVNSQLVGTFYRAEKPGTAPLVAEGTHVEENTVIGIVEALQVLTEVEAGVSGTVTKVMATDGQPVQYGQALLEVLLDG